MLSGYVLASTFRTHWPDTQLSLEHVLEKELKVTQLQYE